MFSFLTYSNKHQSQKNENDQIVALKHLLKEYLVACAMYSDSCFIKKHEHTHLIHTRKIKHQHWMYFHPPNFTLSFASSFGGNFFCLSVLLDS
jgi:hypothetical protein